MPGLCGRSGTHGRVQGKKNEKNKQTKMNVGPLVNQSISASTSLCTRPIHQIIACLYPHFLLYMTCKFLIGERGVFFWKVRHLHQPFCLFRCAWFMLLHMPVFFFFCMSLLLHRGICILSCLGYDLLQGGWLDFQTFSRGLCPVPILYSLHLGE